MGIFIRDRKLRVGVQDVVGWESKCKYFVRIPVLLPEGFCGWLVEMATQHHV